MPYEKARFEQTNCSMSCKCETWWTVRHCWFSGRILACHAGDRGSIPRQCNTFSCKKKYALLGGCHRTSICISTHNYAHVRGDSTNTHVIKSLLMVAIWCEWKQMRGETSDVRGNNFSVFGESVNYLEEGIPYRSCLSRWSHQNDISISFLSWANAFLF